MKDSLWPTTMFVLSAALIGVQTIRRVHVANTTYEERVETAKWTIAFFVIGIIAAGCCLVALWPFNQ